MTARADGICSGAKARFELRQNRVVDETMLPKFWPAVDNAMPDRSRHRHFGFDEHLSDTGDCLPLAGNGTRLGEQRVSARIFGTVFAVFAADRFGFAREQLFDP
jgi:hypothetical protein